jgi:hypothetical protein
MLFLTGCAGSSVLLQGEDRLVRYEQFSKETGDRVVELVLVDERHAGYMDIYSEERHDANIKRVPAPVFEELVRSLEELDFMEMAQRQRPDPYAKRTTRVITVENTRGEWYCVNPEDPLCDEENPFEVLDRTAREYFNRVLALQSVANEEGGELFYKEQRRLEEEKRGTRITTEFIQ